MLESEINDLDQDSPMEHVSRIKTQRTMLNAKIV